MIWDRPKNGDELILNFHQILRCSKLTNNKQQTDKLKQTKTD